MRALGLKIYSDDPLVPYKTSVVSPERSKAEIDGVLAEWQVKDVFWHWDPDHNDVYVQFKLEETIDGLPISVVIKVTCPTIWDRAKPTARPPKLEMINWRISLRCMWWFIKSHLEMAYVTQSAKTVAFLSYVSAADGQHTLKDVILPRLQQIQDMPALPEPTQEQLNRIIDHDQKARA